MKLMQHEVFQTRAHCTAATISVRFFGWKSGFSTKDLVGERFSCKRMGLRARRESTFSQRKIGWEKERPCERYQVRERNCTREGRAAWKGGSKAAKIQQPNVGVG